MIYTRWGGKVTVKANLGKYNLSGRPDAPITLLAVDVEYTDQPHVTYHDHAAAEHLKADDGRQEIFRTINEVPKRQVDKRDLKRILARL